MKLYKTFSLLALFALCTCACSDNEPVVNKHPKPSILHLPAPLSNGMVVQQNSVATLWGTTNPSASVWGEASWNNQRVEVTADSQGRWQLDIPTPAASMESFRVKIGDSHGGMKIIEDVLVGEVWHFAGQSNMEMPMRGFGTVAGGNYQPVENADKEIAAAANMSHLRYFKVGYQASETPMDDVKENPWWRASIATEAKEFSAIAFFCGRRLAEQLNTPIGIICTPYGGTRIEAWMPAHRLSQFHPDDYKVADELSESAAKKSAPGLLYNGMVYPIEKYTLRGWAWYQGESNRDNSHAYARLQQAMVEEWREAKGDNNNSLPFYYVQISGIGTNTNDYGSKLIEAQWDALSLIPNSHLITTSDVGNSEFIHYPNKKTPGERLANIILHNTYGRNDINPYGPQVESVRYEGGKAIVTLSNAAGLHTTTTPIPYVQLAGSDGVFHSATATIGADGVSIEITSNKVSVATNVRYCYSSWHLSTIFNSAGVPLAPFRTDR